MSERQTPLTDGWKSRTAALLAAPGARAELARHLAAGDDAQFNRWKVQIAKVFNTARVPDAEFLLAVDAWLRSPTGRRFAAKPPPRITDG